VLLGRSTDSSEHRHGSQQKNTRNFLHCVQLLLGEKIKCFRLQSYVHPPVNR
jgi:hypothetical protein